jgi:NDP-sugar pyrophosphorylase family protein
LVYYKNEDEIYPISDWLHPGMLPIGNSYDPQDEATILDLPNFEWIIRHLVWQGFRNVSVYSEIEFRGLDYFCESLFSKTNFQFFQKDFFSLILNSKDNADDLIIFSGLKVTNLDLKNVLSSHRNLGNPASLVGIRGIKFEVGLVEFDHDSYEVTKFEEKPMERTQLVNSDILILNLKHVEVTNLIQNFNKNNETTLSNLIESLIQALIDEKLLYMIEGNGIESEVWSMDLSIIETWAKLNSNQFIKRFKHLFDN